MKKEKIYPEERLVKIMDILKKENSVDVERLSELFGVTGATIRADLRDLENRELVTRTYGGAILRDFINGNIKLDRDPSYSSRILQNAAIKEVIGERAAGLIEDGDSIMLDDGSTTLQVAKKIHEDKKVTVITNGLNICMELASHRNVNIIATGGMLNKSDLSYHGRVAEEVASKFRAGKAILGASGISLKNDITAPNEMKAELKKVMITNSSELIIVADHSKLSKIALVPVCGLDKVKTIVTDSLAPHEFVDELRNRGINVIIA